ncbi:hypothetical protein BgAZ_203450 [Babesia gibsoni]|uniref:RING-type domain-containing protein n=1 Tax=Babesia gibsoni TaxID=33632 RepID=A0AAD8LMA8_BABGI|nr:hypothetical protein BgAZ_203450 [Babesia gibsoni]
MGSLVEDVILVDTKKKELFNKLYDNVSSLVTLVNEATACLTCQEQPADATAASNQDGSHPLEQQEKPKGDKTNRHVNGSPNGVHERGGMTHNHQQNPDTTGKAIDSPTNTLECILTKLSKDVKSLDVQRKCMRSYREFHSKYVRLGKELFKFASLDDTGVLSHMDIDSSMLLRMIGIHLLHVGLDDVYEALRNDILNHWGADTNALVPEAVISAYRVLRKLVSKFRDNDFDPLLEWVKKNSEDSHLHIERFNTVLLNIHKMQLLSEYYHMKDGKLERREIDITDEHICKVNSSSLSNVWNLHNGEIGKLLTQVLLGHNLPTPSEFIEIRDETENMFIKLFCENGVIVEKPVAKTTETPERPTDTYPRHYRMSKKQEAKPDEGETNASDPLYEELDPEDLVIRVPIGEEVPSEEPDRSWLKCLEKYNDTPYVLKDKLVKQPRAKQLQDGWLRSLERGDSTTRGYPKIQYSRIRSPILSQSAMVERAKKIIQGKSTHETTLYRSETIRAMCRDPETSCRQMLPRISSSVGPERPVANRAENVYTTNDTENEREEWGRERVHGGVTAMLIAATENTSVRFLALPNVSRLSMSPEYTFGSQGGSLTSPQDTSASDSQSDNHPTVSLTLFTGSQAIRDSLLSSQTSEGEGGSRIISSEGGRIRITFPPRGEHSTELIPSHGRRTVGSSIRLHPYRAENVAADLPFNEGEGMSGSGHDREEGSSGTDMTNINVRGIIRMIMRGITGISPESPDAVIQLSPGVGISVPSIGTRRDSIQNREDTERIMDTPKPSQTYKGAFHRAYEIEEGEGFIRVFLPYESPISVLVCAGYIIHPRLAEILGIQNTNEDVSHKLDSWLRSSKQLPIESDLGPSFCFHSYLTCPISKDQTSSKNLPVMLPCGHVICSSCVDSFKSDRRKYQFKCPLCPKMISPVELKQLFLDWNYCGLDEPI